MHRDIVPFCTPRVESLGHSSLCTTQIFYVEDRLISVQGHPEYNGNICREFLEQRRGTVLDEPHICRESSGKILHTMVLQLRQHSWNYY